MKTWIVVLYLGRSINVIGPFYDDIPTCRDSIADRQQFHMFSEQAGHTIEEVTLDCVRSRTRPLIGEQR